MSTSHHMRDAYIEAIRTSRLPTNADGCLLLDEVDQMDIYACFPVAVEHACDVLGVNPLNFSVEKMTATGVFT